ncbi:MAG TPA: complex I NDUFA9 subunit family protein [Gemmatimonadaceae bacterium]|nr:complex I NDUFA9 subunit family protein [Gemmatimonadaceae bacterium]
MEAEQPLSGGAEQIPVAAVEEQPAPVTTAEGRTVVVTGASGLVGTHTCRELARRGWTVRALARDPAKVARRLVALPVKVVAADIRDPEALSAAMRGATAVVHLAAIAIERPGQHYEDVNTLGTERVLAAAREAEATRVVHMSQLGASSDSPFRFLRSKGVAEDLVRGSGLRWTVFRPSVIFGPEDEFVNVLARLVRLSPFVYPLPGGGRARFQPVAVGDVARAVGAALDTPETIGHAYPLGGPAALTLRQMTERVLLAMDEERVLVGVPVWLLRPLVALAQRILPHPPVTTSLLDLLEVDNTVGDSSPWHELGITPTPFAPEELTYLKDITLRDAIDSLLHGPR